MDQFNHHFIKFLNIFINFINFKIIFIINLNYYLTINTSHLNYVKFICFIDYFHYNSLRIDVF